MIKFKKILTTAVLLVCLLPLATAFCCCTDSDINSSHQEEAGHHHDQAAHHQEQGHHHEKSDPDSCECGHEIVGDTNSQTVNISSLSSQATQVFNKNLFVDVSQVLDFNKSIYRFNDTGPPGQFSAVPLYLKLSVLRI